MATKLRTMEEVREQGIHALSQALGPADMLRFFQQFENGAGEHVAERYQMFGDTDVRTIAREIREGRERKPNVAE